MTSSARSRYEIESVTELVDASVEAPHVVYPKGPIRKITSLRIALDEVAGEIVMVTLSCGHGATLVGTNITSEAIVRCPMCFFERQAKPVVLSGS